MRSRVKSFVHDWPDSTIRGCRQGLLYVEWVATEALRLYHLPTVNYRLVINDLDVDRFVISGLATMNEAAGAADAAFVPYSSHMRREASIYRRLQHKFLTHYLSVSSDSISI
jgi:hypothetical protein